MRPVVTSGRELAAQHSASHSAFRWILAAGVLLCTMLPGRATAQVPGRFDVVSVSHQPNGRVTATVQVNDAKLLAPGNITVTVDGAPRMARVVAPADRGPLPVVIAIDTSGSMAGAPMTAAKDAVRQLVGVLTQRDPVAILAFSSKAEVVAPFGVDRAATNGAVQGLNATGDTALYQAVEGASELAAGAGGGVVVLISDGEDTSGPPAGRETTLRSTVARGTPVFVFGVGSAVDAPYLRSLAEVSGGRYEAVATADGLRRILSDLGRTLATSTTIEVAVPPLSIGNHTVQFRIGDKPPIDRSVPFQVGNAGLLAATAVAPADPADPIAIRVTSAVPLSSLKLKMRIEGRDTNVAANGEAMLDPWTVAPGATNVEVVALTDGVVVAQTKLQVIVPELKPVLTVKRTSLASSERLTINGRAQSPAGQTLVVKIDGTETSRSTEPLIQVEVPNGSEAAIELSTQHVVLTETVEVGASSILIERLPVAAGMIILLTFAAWLVFNRKRSVEHSAAVARALQPAGPRSRQQVSTIAAASQAAEQMTNIIVRTPEGQTRRILVRRGAALTIGTDSSCDIRLADDSVRARHGLLTRLADGHFELHAIGAESGAVVNHASAAGRVLLRPGDPVRIGQHVLVVE